MLTRLRIRNFKQFDDVDIELAKAVVLIGPNNSGKTTALQALALWEIGVRRWNEKRAGKSSPEKRPGVTVNRRDLLSIPVPDANLLWRDLHVQKRVEQVEKEGKKSSRPTISESTSLSTGSRDKPWSCRLEFDYANKESFYCRPRGLIPREQLVCSFRKKRLRSRCLPPPMSVWLTASSSKQPGEIGVLIGQGQTAQVLRNLCFQIHQEKGTSGAMEELVSHIKSLFGVR